MKLIFLLPLLFVLNNTFAQSRPVLSDSVFYFGPKNNFEVLYPDSNFFIIAKHGVVRGVYPNYTYANSIANVDTDTIFYGVMFEKSYSTIVSLKKIDDIYISIVSQVPSLNIAYYKNLANTRRFHIKSQIMENMSITGEIISYTIEAYKNDKLDFKMTNIGNYINDSFYEGLNDYHRGSYFIFKEFIISINSCLYYLSDEIKLNLLPPDQRSMNRR